VDTRDQLPARVLDAADRTKEREDQPRRTTRDLRTRVAKCTEVDGGIFEHLLRTVTNLSFYTSLTVHLGIILVNNQLGALFSIYLFISILCMFRATQCSSSGESIHHLVYITL
jgi:hypothetical protein